MPDLRAEISAVLNRHSAENGSLMPDFILAEYLTACLSAFNAATVARENWYGRPATPSQVQVGGVPDPNWP